MLQPARTKYRKQQKGRNTGIATRGAKVSFGEYGLKATTRGPQCEATSSGASTTWPLRTALTCFIPGRSASAAASWSYACSAGGV